MKLGTETYMLRIEHVECVLVVCFEADVVRARHQIVWPDHGIAAAVAELETRDREILAWIRARGTELARAANGRSIKFSSPQIGLRSVIS